jgi:hypothetical protein
MTCSPVAMRFRSKSICLNIQLRLWPTAAAGPRINGVAGGVEDVAGACELYLLVGAAP